MPIEPPVKHAVAFIDGQNLYRHAMEAFGHHHPNYDPIKLHNAVCEANGWKPTLVRFYTGVPQTKDDLKGAAYWSNRVLSMKRAGIHVTTRHLRYREKEVYNQFGQLETIKFAQEKGIDIRICLDVINLALTRQFDVGVIFSQDQDINEVVSEVAEIAKQQDRFLNFSCAFPISPTASYRRGINGTQWVEMDQTFYDQCLDPRDYRPKKSV